MMTADRGERLPASWMTAADDDIMELVREHGNLSPKAVESFGGPRASHVSRRAALLCDYGLLTRIYRGLFGMTDKGRWYLDGRLDASALSADES